MSLAYGFTPNDCNLNMMPLFHIGGQLFQHKENFIEFVQTKLVSLPLCLGPGLARNILAPILSGGSVVCLTCEASIFKLPNPFLFLWGDDCFCSCLVLYFELFSHLIFTAFDAERFWALIGLKGVTWYYGSPTMHQLILDHAASLSKLPRHSVRIICNAAGPLPHTTATKLNDTFKATVLPSYGMTECMPISAPPATYNLDYPGTSGRALGPQIAVVDDHGVMCGPNETGEIVLKGLPLFEG